MNYTNEGATVHMMRERERKLAEECDIARGRVTTLEARLDELRQAIGKLTHAKSKRHIPSATQPGPDDDRVSLDEAQGILVPQEESAS